MLFQSSIGIQQCHPHNGPTFVFRTSRDFKDENNFIMAFMRHYMKYHMLTPKDEMDLMEVELKMATLSEQILRQFEEEDTRN